MQTGAMSARFPAATTAPTATAFVDRKTVVAAALNDVKSGLLPPLTAIVAAYDRAWQRVVVVGGERMDGMNASGRLEGVHSSVQCFDPPPPSYAMRWTADSGG